jgi:hypothetical protein
MPRPRRCATNARSIGVSHLMDGVWMRCAPLQLSMRARCGGIPARQWGAVCTIRGLLHFVVSGVSRFDQQPCR